MLNHKLSLTGTTQRGCLKGRYSKRQLRSLRWYKVLQRWKLKYLCLNPTFLFHYSTRPFPHLTIFSSVNPPPPSSQQKKKSRQTLLQRKRYLSKKKKMPGPPKKERKRKRKTAKKREKYVHYTYPSLLVIQTTQSPPPPPFLLDLFFIDQRILVVDRPMADRRPSLLFTTSTAGAAPVKGHEQHRTDRRPGHAKIHGRVRGSDADV